MPEIPIVILGAGGHARVLAEALALSAPADPRRLIGHVAPEADKSGLLGPYLGDDSLLPDLADSCHFAIGIGFVDRAGAQRRSALLARLEALSARLATVIHPHSVVSPSAWLEEGVFIAMGAMAGTGTHIGRAAILNSGAVADHDCRIAANVHIATGARLAGGISVGADVLIGAGSVLIQGLQIGDGAVIGAGTVAIRPVEAGQTVAGNPQRLIGAPHRERPGGQPQQGPV